MRQTIFIEIYNWDIKDSFLESLKNEKDYFNKFNLIDSMAILVDATRLQDIESILKDHKVIYSKKTFIEKMDEFFDMTFYQ